MSSFPRVRNRQRTKSIVTASVLAVLFAAVLLFGVVRLASDRPDRANLGDPTFQAGSAERLATRIREQSAPFLFKDPLTSGPGRELYLLHAGSDPAVGWLGVNAYAPGAPHELRCILTWDGGAALFRDPCDGRTYPGDATGLQTYPADVRSGQVVVDLRTATAAPTS